MFYIPLWIRDKGIIDIILESKDQRMCVQAIQRIPAYSTFLAYQVFVDLTYIPEFPFSENEFTVSGSGCHKGLELLFTERDGLTDEELLFWLRDNQEWLFDIYFDKLFDNLPAEDRRLSVMDLENCMCEHSKHYGIVKGKGTQDKKNWAYFKEDIGGRNTSKKRSC